MSMKASEQIFDDSVVYVTKQGTQVRVDEGRIVIWDVDGDEGELGSFPVKKLDTINVFGNINFTTPFVKRANDYGIVLNYFTQNGKYKGSFIPKKNTIAEVRRKQYGITGDEELEIAKSMIKAKIKNSRTFLKRKGVKGLGKIKDIQSRIEESEKMKELRGYEGVATEEYFRLLDGALVGDWAFTKRTKNPPKDHINSLMSLTYVMMKNEVISALRQYNLDPFLGIMHTDRHGRPSLALDLLEEFRPIFCDAFTTRLVNRGTITHDDFKKNNHLKDEKFKTYLEKFDSYMKEEFKHPHFDYKVSKRKSIRMQSVLLRKRITGEMDEYHALKFKR
ncbi:MAG: CRISPR-associated protein Cas1 [Candidatus Methanohalarchaeum thermophilum]|uniref:CRISPR-associated endonuclease Cas1 n=1 Tax=Methanohalarchaeum thermophilum TaxID=1903181 RepID=A0A1Q6DWN5_METT1|nr:MAG: CRISPR-associated protein Cas1 [Candidatus Methanohalarchaeum thermophilum]